MSDLTDIQGILTQVGAKLTAINASTTALGTLISGLPATGGLSEADVATLKSNASDILTQAGADADALAALIPATPINS